MKSDITKHSNCSRFETRVPVDGRTEYHEKFYLTMYSSEENTGNDKVGCYGVLYAFNLNTYGR